MSDKAPLDPPCHRCPGRCCQQQNTGWPFAVQLVEADGDKFDEYAIYNDLVQAKVLPYNEQGRCHYLGADNRCSIHDVKPMTCREFTCTEGHLIFLSRNPALVELLDEIEGDTR